MKAQECRLNLCFQLNVPKALAGKIGVSQDKAVTGESLQEMMEQVFDSEEERIFQRIAKQNYAPMLEILESKLRRHANFRATVIVDPRWLALAKKYNEVLANRLRGVVLTGRVDLVYGLSLVGPVSKDKSEVLLLAKQVKRNQENFWQVLGTKCRVVCLTDLTYDADLAGLLEKMGFEAYLMRDNQKLNTWAGVNEVYLPVSCDKMLAIIENNSLARLLLQRSRFEMVDGEIMLMDDFYRKVIAECWKGGVVTLVLDAEEMQIDADTQDGIASFIRDLVERWFESNMNVFTSVAKICELNLPFAELELAEDTESFNANKIMERIRQNFEAGKVQEDKSEKKVHSVEQNNVLPVKDEDVVVVKTAKKKVPRAPLVADGAELVNVNFTRNKKQPSREMISGEQDEIKVVIGGSKTKKELPLPSASVMVVPEEQVAVKRTIKKKPNLELSKMPRPVKAPGHVLQTKMIDKAQQESRLHEDDTVEVKRNGSLDDSDRITLDFDDLWTFDSSESPKEEVMMVGKQKIPSIGSGNSKFGGIQEEDTSQGEIEQFDYNLVKPQKGVRQIRFTAIGEGDFGEIYEHN